MKKNILANFVGKFWSILSNFLFIPLYIKYLGFESYSIISFTLIIAGILGVLDAGLTATLSREFARTDTRPAEKIRIFKTIESIFVIVISVAIITVILASGFIVNNWLNLKTYNPEKIALFIRIIAFDIGFQLLFRFYLGGLLGIEKQVEANFLQVCWGILRNGIVVLVIFFYPSLKIFFYWQAISTILFTFLVKLYLENILTGKMIFRFSLQIENDILRKVWKFAGGMMLISLVAALNTQLDKITISKLLPIDHLGYYTLSVSLAQVLVVLASPVATALLPRFTAYFSAKEPDKIVKLYNRASVFTSIFIFSFTAVMIFFSKELIWVWTGNINLAQNASSYLPVISISMAMLSVVTIPYTIAIANGYTRLNNILGLASLVITLPGYWIATLYYGAIGAAYVFCIVQTLITFVYLFFINKKFLKLKVLKDVYIKQIIIPFVITLFIAFLFSKFPGVTGLNRLLSVFWLGVVTIGTIGLTTVIGMPKNEIKYFIRKRLLKK